MKIIGGDFNVEIGPGEGVELSSLCYYTFNKANCKGEKMIQWILANSFVALNTMFMKVLRQRVTRHSKKR